MAQHYAIKNLDQARRYLADTTLGVRLREAVKLMVEHRDKPVFEILGSPDDLEFRSCVTLFREAASEPRPVHQSLGYMAANLTRVLWRCYARPGRGRLETCPFRGVKRTFAKDWSRQLMTQSTAVLRSFDRRKFRDY